jgi:Tfp pilus assembly protein PilN
MINLLPPNIKQNYTYAHRNAILVKWAWAFVCGLGGLILITLLGVLYMNQSISNYSSQVAQGQTSLATQHIVDTQKQVNDISNSLNLVVKVLGSEVLFSKLLSQIATIIPTNASLTNLSIAKVQGALDLTAVTTDYNAATQLQINLQDPANKIFSRADIQSITCGNSNNSDNKYPCTVTIRALFAANNPYLFISNSTAKGTQ